ncbi:hypothetical protein CP533_3267 [Ophiocordyceps camponoti-saundersi (nom. inval.)]|nr:hypothetical protein CP533_3267 [Ophiocordyceps camponoti-saundersi (nom. inval.)]
MQALNAAGRQVSLLNDDTDANNNNNNIKYRPTSFQSTTQIPPRPYPSPRSSSSSPITPELLRSNSYDSHMSSDPISPLTPSADFAYPRASLYPPIDGPPPKRPTYGDSSRSTSFDDDNAVPTHMPDQRPSKRYPCRYRDSHGCEKTFTTSGHASRHSKIHTAEKAVQCTFQGCQKKFTRADNMKQHLETHYKDKSRSSASSRAHKALVEARRASAASGRGRSPMATSPSMGGREAPPWDSVLSDKHDQHHHHRHHRQHRHRHHHHHHHHHRTMAATTLPSPTRTGWDMANMSLPLLSRPLVARTPSNGLDALAMVVACQEGGS